MVSGIREVTFADPYITDQLIPYIGNKRKLLPLIGRAVRMTGVDGGVFFDAFAGSGVVSRYAKVAGFRVVSNDWEPYSEVINRAYVEANRPPAFERLGGIDAAFAQLNSLPGERGYIASHYCPADDESYDVDRERMFYTQQNGRRIDAVRGKIELWKAEGRIDALEEAVLLASLIYQASYCSNTSGVFKGFHRGWGGATRTAWYRIRSFLTLKPPLFWDNGQPNLVFRDDASALAPEIECDVAYLDPPYNQHQYGANYHLLNTIALWDKPELSQWISGNGKRDKAAIRTDWRSLRRSPYCYRSTALGAFAELVGKLRARFILVSYSTDGIIPVGDMLDVLVERGALDVFVRSYKRYRVSSQRPSPRPHNTEFVAVVNTAEPSGREHHRRAVDMIMNNNA
jgi:adenine-specific DNA-methyltransferase